MKTFDQSFPTWGACPTGRVQQYFGRAQVGHAPLKESHGPPYSTLLYVLKIYLFKYPFVLKLFSFIDAMFFGTLFRYQVDDKRGIFIIKIKYHKNILCFKSVGKILFKKNKQFVKNQVIFFLLNFRKSLFVEEFKLKFFFINDRKYLANYYS